MGNEETLVDRSATDLAADIQTKAIAPTELTEAYLDRIDERDEEIGAYVTVTDELARETARRVERERGTTEESGPLQGVPIALKDGAYLKEGVRHTNGSALFAEVGFEAPRTSVATERLEAAGAVLLGKTNLPEFGHKGVTDNEIVGATVTPFDTSKNAGGSSGGSAAAVAAGMAAAATGSDAGGSIRTPAALCGVFGLKPSFGLIPWDRRPDGFGRKIHHAVLGPITRSVEDAALLMEVMAGPHPSDPSSHPVDLDYRGATDRPVDDLRVAYSRNLDVFDVDDEVHDVTTDAIGALEAAGATVETVSVDHGMEREELTDTIEATFTSELATGLAVLRQTTSFEPRSHPETSESLLRMLDIAEGIDDTDLALARVTRTRLFESVQALLEEFDLLVTPTLGRAGVDRHLGFEEHMEWVRRHVLTWPFNITGHPAASVPAGLTDDDLPVGLQVIGRRYDDETVLAASAAIERQCPWDLPL